MSCVRLSKTQLLLITSDLPNASGKSDPDAKKEVSSSSFFFCVTASHTMPRLTHIVIGGWQHRPMALHGQQWGRSLAQQIQVSGVTGNHWFGTISD